jgi:hypothetical protein
MLVSVDSTASPPGRKPMSTFWAAIRLRVSSPAATSSTIVTAIWVTTRPSRSVHRRPPAWVAAMSLFSSLTRFGPRRLQRRRKAGHKRREHRDAGGEEQHAPVDAQREGDGIGIGRLIEVAIRVNSHASATPTPAPSAAMTMLSDRSCCTSRRRLAPIARRMPISFWRPEARASSMLATFAQAITSTRPTTNIRPRPIGRSARSATGWMCTSLVGTVLISNRLFVAS